MTDGCRRCREMLRVFGGVFREMGKRDVWIDVEGRVFGFGNRVCVYCMCACVWNSAGVFRGSGCAYVCVASCSRGDLFVG